MAMTCECGCFSFRWLHANQCSLASHHEAHLPRSRAQIDQNDLVSFLASPEGELIGSACDPITLALLASCCTSLHQVICKPDLVKRRAEDWSLNGHCCLLEHLAFNLAMSELCDKPDSNHVRFGYGGGKTPLASAVPFIHTAAAIAKRFPRAKVHVDAHAGVYAPSHRIADKCSQARAQSVRQHLLAQGVGAGQITSTAWGKNVSAHWGEQDDRVARAEVYLCLDEIHVPEKPEYYRNSPSCCQEEPPAFHIYNRDGHFWLLPEEELEFIRERWQ
ncbi:unnamed protein product [Durusdinium trenchii]|uniref:OmpA-like domain-containing protein n=2 Tax=Durusdinium trenchii TaxID=1381693 RepID=A0ABP0QYZ4_9DINO